MDTVDKEMRAKVRQLCTVKFGHKIMKSWDARDKEKKNYIIEKIKRDFLPACKEVSNNKWIKCVLGSCKSHPSQRHTMQ